MEADPPVYNHKVSIKLAPYAEQYKTWPKHGRCVLAHYS